MPKTASHVPARPATAASRENVIPPDSEPLTAADLREIRESEAALRRGDYVSLEELEADVARLRSTKAGPKDPAVPCAGPGSPHGGARRNARRSLRG